MATIFFNITKHFFKVLCYVFFSSVFTNVNAQTNLVLNPSFEQYTNCPDNTYIQGQLNSKPDDWYKPDSRGAAYLNACQNIPPHFGIPYNSFGGDFSYQYPRTGNAYFGLSYLNSNHHNYIQTQLKDSCRNGKKYYAEYYVNLTNGSKYGCNNIGMLFTNNVVYADTINKSLLLANPQIFGYGNPIVTDTMSWVKISGIFTAQGGEQYLTLGNFKNQANTQTKNIQPTGYDGSGYYVDDVAVYNLDSFCLKADAGRDTTISVNDSVFIGSYTNGIDTIKWYNAAGQLIDSTRPGFIVHPTTTGTTMYIVEQTINGCTTRDTVNINIVLPLKFISYNLVPSLRGTKQSVENLWQTANEINVSHYNIQRSINAKDFATIGTVRANNKSYNEYEFIDELKTKDQDLKTLYYRIQAVDKDGKLTYSEVKILNLKPSTLNSVSIFPNPAKDVVHIECKQGISKLLITDYLGREIATGTNLSNDGNLKLYTLNLKHLSKGVYLVKIVTNNGKIVTERLIIE